MPIYEYRCGSCGEVFEAIQKLSDLPLGQCKFCGGPVERLISQSSFQLKGSGWYLTDYARKSKSAGEASETGGKPSEKSGEGSTSGTSKTEAPAAAKPKTDAKE